MSGRREWQAFATFDVRGEPKGQPRPRAFYNKKMKRASVYDAGTAEGWKGMVVLAAKPYLPVVPLDCPIKLYVSFMFPRPGRLMRKKDPDGRIPHTAKPDTDNAIKAVMDALTQVGMWRDDALVVDQHATKDYAAKGECPGAVIQIHTLKGES